MFTGVKDDAFICDFLLYGPGEAPVVTERGTHMSFKHTWKVK